MEKHFCDCKDCENQIDLGGQYSQPYYKVNVSIDVGRDDDMADGKGEFCSLKCAKKWMDDYLLNTLFRHPSGIHRHFPDQPEDVQAGGI